MKTPIPTWLVIFSGGILFLILAQLIDGRIAFIIGLVFIAAVYYMRSRQTKNLMKQFGLNKGEWSTIKDDLRREDKEAGIARITDIQKRARKEFKDISGLDAANLIPEIGRDISWEDIVFHAFRVLEFDKTDTKISDGNRVIASSTFAPYGYLIVESPILNNKAKLPIIHQDDFLLAASVFDEPKLAGIVETRELLVTYAPERLLPKGLSGSPSHVLHYVITPRGTLNSYYSINDDMHMAKPDPQKLFGRFVYHGEIRVQINSEPKL